MTSIISVGVSSCLLGNPVRYDGGHKRDRYRVKIYDPSGNAIRKGRGLFATAVADFFPLLPHPSELMLRNHV